MNNIPIRTLSELQSYNASIKKEKDEWKNKATMLFNKNEELERQNDSLRKKYKTILADNQEKDSRIALYTQKLERLQTQNRKLEKISVDSDLKKQYSDNERRKRKEEIDSYQSQIKKLTETCDNYKIQILDLQQQLNQISQEKDVLLQAVELKADEFNLPSDDPNSLRIILEEGQQKQIAITLSEQLDQMTKQYNMEKDHSSKLELLLNDKNEEIRSLQSYIDTHTNEREDLSNELEAARNAVEDMSHRYNVLQSENQEIQKYNKQLIDTIQQYQLSDDNMKQEIETMAERMNEMQVNQQEFTEIQNQTIELQTKLDEKDRLYNDLKLQLTQLQQQYNNINSDYNNLNDQYHYILEANATLTSELDEYKEQNLKKDSQETLEKKVDELSDIVKQQQENIQKQQTEVLDLRNKNEKMENEMKDKNSDIVLYQTKVAHLEAHIVQLQSHIETLKRTKEVYERDRRSIDRTTPIINRINANNDTSPGTYHDIINRSLSGGRNYAESNNNNDIRPPSPLVSSYNTRRSSLKNNNNNRRRTSLQPSYDNELPINDLINNY